MHLRSAPSTSQRHESVLRIHILIRDDMCPMSCILCSVQGFTSYSVVSPTFDHEL